jgi:hypothetical protein
MDRVNVMSHALGFRPRFERLDDCILTAARRRNPDVSSMEQALREPAQSLADVFPTTEPLPRHFGRTARALWTLVDQVFKAADDPVDCPPGSQAKSVQVADIYEAPPAGGDDRTAYLALWFEPGESVLAPSPRLPAILLGEGAGTLADTRSALRQLVWEICERLNTLAPAARALGAGPQWQALSED